MRCRRAAARTRLAILAALGTMLAAPAAAQRIPFEKAFAADGIVRLDVETVNGQVRVGGADSDRIVVQGTVTVKVGWNVPVNAPEIAARVAAAPPIQRAGDILMLRTPSDPVERRAVTIAYNVTVPRRVAVAVVTTSGAVDLRNVGGGVSVRTQSAAIDLADLGGGVSIETQSGDVEVTAVAGDLTVKTGSSRFTGSGLAGGLRVRTESGAVDASMQGTGALDVETGSSQIHVRRVGGAVRAASRTGSVSIDGRSGGAWDVETGSSAIDLRLDGPAGFELDARTSSRVKVSGGRVDGTVGERAVRGTVRGGGPLVRVSSRSGAIELILGPD